MSLFRRITRLEKEARFLKGKDEQHKPRNLFVFKPTNEDIKKNIKGLTCIWYDSNKYDGIQWDLSLLSWDMLDQLEKHITNNKG